MSTSPGAPGAPGTHGAPDPDGTLDDLLCFELYSLSRAMTALYRPVLAPLNLTYPQFLVLEVLTRHGSRSIGEIGAATRLDHGTLTPMLRRMADRGLLTLERATIDGRSMIAELSPRGRELRPDLERVHCHIRETVGMSTDDLDDLQRLLHQLDGQLTAATGVDPVTPD